MAEYNVLSSSYGVKWGIYSLKPKPNPLAIKVVMCMQTYTQAHKTSNQANNHDHLSWLG